MGRVSLSDRTDRGSILFERACGHRERERERERESSECWMEGDPGQLAPGAQTRSTLRVV